MKRTVGYTLAAVLTLALVLGSGAGAANAIPADTRATAPEAASACRTVVKKVRGKRRRVRVCAKPKPRPRRLDVSVTLDARRASSLSLTSAGGTAVLQSANGATLTVTFPAGATPTDVSVRVTPISSIRGLPLRTLVAGVQLEPDGLQLARPATVTVEPPRIPSGRLFGFAYEGSGRNLVPYRVVRDGGALTFTITHFSGYGAGVGTEAARQALVGPLLAEAGTIQAQFMAAAHNPSLLADGIVLDRYMAWKAAALYYRLPELAAYQGNLAVAARQAVEATITLARLRCRDPLRRELKPSFDVYRALHRAVTLGLVELVQRPPSIVLEECLRFELDAEFRLTFHREGGDREDFWSDDGVVEVRVEKVPITYAAGLQGWGEPTIATWNYTYFAHYVQNLKPDPPVDCSGHEVSAVPTKLFHARLDVYAAEGERAPGPDITIFVDPGDIDAKARIECPPPLQGLSGTTGVDYASSWRPAFPEKLEPDGRLRVPVLPPLGNYVGRDVFATYGPETKTYEHSFGSGKVSGTLTWKFTLRHVPGG